MNLQFVLESLDRGLSLFQVLPRSLQLLLDRLLLCSGLLQLLPGLPCLLLILLVDLHLVLKSLDRGLSPLQVLLHPLQLFLDLDELLSLFLGPFLPLGGLFQGCLHLERPFLALSNQPFHLLSERLDLLSGLGKLIDDLEGLLLILLVSQHFVVERPDGGLALFQVLHHPIQLFLELGELLPLFLCPLLLAAGLGQHGLHLGHLRLSLLPLGQGRLFPLPVSLELILDQGGRGFALPHGLLHLLQPRLRPGQQIPVSLGLFLPPRGLLQLGPHLRHHRLLLLQGSAHHFHLFQVLRLTGTELLHLSREVARQGPAALQLGLEGLDGAFAYFSRFTSPVDLEFEIPHDSGHLPALGLEDFDLSLQVLGPAGLLIELVAQDLFLGHEILKPARLLARVSPQQVHLPFGFPDPIPGLFELDAQDPGFPLGLHGLILLLV